MQALLALQPFGSRYWLPTQEPLQSEAEQQATGCVVPDGQVVLMRLLQVAMQAAVVPPPVLENPLVMKQV